MSGGELTTATAAAATKREYTVTENKNACFGATIKRLKAAMDSEDAMVVSKIISNQSKGDYLRCMNGCDSDENSEIRLELKSNHELF